MIANVYILELGDGIFVTYGNLDHIDKDESEVTFHCEVEPLDTVVTKYILGSEQTYVCGKTGSSEELGCSTDRKIGLYVNRD